MKIGKIESDIPFPEVTMHIDYPWPEMEVGESVLIQPDDGEKLYSLKRKVGPSARYYGERTGKRFKTIIEHESNGLRVWRME